MFTCSCSSQNIYTHVQFVNFMKALALDGFEKIKWLNERILNECKDCVGAWVLQITGTGVGTLSEDRIYSQSNLCLPHIAKQTFGRRGRINQFENVNLPESYCGFGNAVQCKRVLNEDFSSTRKLIR